MENVTKNKQNRCQLKNVDLYWWVNLECVHDCVWVHAHAESGQKCLKQL